MKKLIYMLSLTIGLVLAGCAQWEKPEPQSPDNFGQACELVVTMDSVVTTGTATLTVETVGAKYIAFLLSEKTIANLDYTDLLQEKMGATLVDTKVEGDVYSVQYKNLPAGMVYTLYVVAANEQGRQTTYTQSVQTIDETAPTIKNPLEALKPSKDGKKVTVVFDENIKRTEGMGDITYDIIYLDKANKQYVEIAKNAPIGSASASGANLTLSLPSTVNFEIGLDYIVLLSFAEGAVEDLFGNKMAAVTNGIVNNKPTGPFWNVNVQEQEDPSTGESFFANGKKYIYLFGIDFEGEGNYQEATTAFNAWTLVDNNYEDPQMGTCKLWAISSMLDMFEDNEEAGVYPNHEVPAITYTYEIEAGYETEMVSIIMPGENEFPSLGEIVLKYNDGTTARVELLPGQWDIENAYGGGKNMLYIGWDFALYEFNMQGTKFPGLSYMGVQPIMFFLDGSGNPQILAQIDGEAFQIFREDLLPSGSAKVTMLDEPIKLSKDNLKVLDRSKLKSLKLAK